MSTKSKPLRIIALTAENVKRLSAVHIEPKGNVVQITGKNRNGKTSVLDSIWWAIEGASHIQKSPIRTGQAKARIRLDLGEIIVTRRFAAKEDGGYTTSISVESPDGAVFKSPQKLLDDLVGELSFDPLAFAQGKPKEQFDALKKFVTDVDIEHVDALIAGDRARRTKVGQDLDVERGAAAAIVIPDEPPCDRVDENALTTQLQEAGDKNAVLERRIANRANVAAEVARLRANAEATLAAVTPAIEAKREAQQTAESEINGEIADLRSRITNLEAKREAGRRQLETDIGVIQANANTSAFADRANANEEQAKLDSAEALPGAIDTSVLAAQLNAARDSNKLLDDWERDRAKKADHQKKAADHEADWDCLTDSIAKRTQQKQAAIAKAHLPIDGLGFGDGFITLNGQPFEQASDAEQWEASIAIAAALNPRLRVIRVRQGSLLDDDAMKRLEEVAERLDFQVWIERVDGSGTVGFVLEDGHLKSLDSEPTIAAVADASAGAANDSRDSLGGAA